MSIPAYKRIQSYILNDIDSGVLSPGSQIPTEMALAEQFDVSRMTVNKAIVGLSNRQILTRIAGKGTFVTKKKAELPLMQIVDFAEEIQLRGKIHHAEVIIHQWQSVFDEQALRLGMADGTQAGYCEVLHFEDATPLLLESRFVNPAHVPEFMAQDFSKITPTAYLLKHFPLTEIEHTIEAISGDVGATELLALAPDSPCLQITRRTWYKDILISFVQFTAAGSRYKMRSRYQTG